MMENEPMNAEDKKRDLYLRQKELLATLLEHGAISQAQHDKSLRDLTEKMGMQPSNEPND
jgi:DNA-binding MarR family transcriptional regulator